MLFEETLNKQRKWVSSQKAKVQQKMLFHSSLEPLIIAGVTQIIFLSFSANLSTVSEITEPQALWVDFLFLIFNPVVKSNGVIPCHEPTLSFSAFSSPLPFLVITWRTQGESKFFEFSRFVIKSLILCPSIGPK